MAEAGWGVVERRESFPGTVAGRAACWEEEAWGGRNPHPRGSRGPQGDGKTLSGASWTCCVLVHGQIWPLKLLTHSLLIDPPQLHISDVMTGADSHVTVCVTHSVNPLHVSALNSSPTEVGALSPFALVETETEM